MAVWFTISVPTPCPGNIAELKCPACGSSALYRYGRGRTGGQRFFCMICGRQFTLGAKRVVVQARPTCPLCKTPMHLYKRELEATRFRCSEYPRCRRFTKVAKEV
jgi:transposase-like protein